MMKKERHRKSEIRSIARVVLRVLFVNLEKDMHDTKMKRKGEAGPMFLTVVSWEGKTWPKILF